MSDLQQLIKAKKFLDAARKVIEGRLPGVTPDDETVTQVSGIVQEAIKRQHMMDVHKILKFLPRWVDKPTTELAQAHLLETTITEDVEEIDIDAYRV